ncbi:unnamed protein product [Arabis nemorensis]|uniref:Uncharacterized protein n=1 Tax=Arabis nemorensis TaxID=586526 RepID=A0A565BA31_9BRAS|nr:unnamed protein product [Arabis nemorensis]
MILGCDSTSAKGDFIGDFSSDFPAVFTLEGKGQGLRATSPAVSSHGGACVCGLAGLGGLAGTGYTTANCETILEVRGDKIGARTT